MTLTDRLRRVFRRRRSMTDEEFASAMRRLEMHTAMHRALLHRERASSYWADEAEHKRVHDEFMRGSR